MYYGFRSRNTTRSGSEFSAATKAAVWNVATIAPGRDKNEWRIDDCGALIRWSEYGNTVESGCGWEIDHIHPVALGGSDELSNLRALQWQNNRFKSDKPARFACLVSFKNA